MFLNGYPYTDFHEMNLDFLIKSMKELEQAFKDFTASNSLIFADPIYHDMTTTYAKNTIVIDAEGNAYISKQNVPSGVQLGNTDYWMLVFDFEGYVERANKNFTVNYFSNVTRSDRALEVGDWLVLDDVLYKVTTDIPVDGEFIIGTNIVHFTVEQFLKDFTTSIVNIVNQYKDDIDASELAYRQQLARDIANTTTSLQAQLNLAISGVTVDSEVINARLGFDGVTYSTLGDAIRTQFENRKAALDNIMDGLSFTWQQGFYRESDGAYINAGKFICTNDYIDTSVNKKIEVFYSGPITLNGIFFTLYNGDTFRKNVTITSGLEYIVYTVPDSIDKVYINVSAGVAVVPGFNTNFIIT